MKLAIVGSRVLESDQLRLVGVLIAHWLNANAHKITWVVSGGAPGTDRIASLAARQMGFPVTELVPASQNWETGYKPRNIHDRTAMRRTLMRQECVRIAKVSNLWFGLDCGLR